MSQISDPVLPDWSDEPVEDVARDSDDPAAVVRAGEGDGDGSDRDERLPGEAWWPTVETVVTVLVVGACALFTLFQMRPGWVFADTTPAGGDLGAHVWGPAFLRDHLLPHGRLSGWTHDWYGGFPMYHFYMVVPAIIVVLLDVVMPYGVALKVISIAGIVTLPVVCWAFGRLTRLPFPVPALLAVAATFFLFDDTYLIYGGNIASTMAGEFSFSVSLSLTVLFLGTFARGLETGKWRAGNAVLFAVAALCHGIVAIFGAVGAVLVALLWLGRRGEWGRRFWYAVTVGVPGSLLTMFWMLPGFLSDFIGLNAQYTTDMYYERRPSLPYGRTPDGKRADSYWEMLFPQSTTIDRLLFLLAAIGLAVSIWRRWRAGIFLGVTALGFAVWACVWPQHHLWNARLLPFMYLSRYLLAAIGVVALGEAAARLIRPDGRLVAKVAAVVTAVAVVAASIGAMSFHLRNLPGGRYDSQGRYTWGPFTAGADDPAGFVSSWALWNFKGYEEKAAYGEYYGLVTTMKELGRTRGCGRAMWENNNDQDKYGTPMSLMLLPFWTDGCIGSMEGLFFEASATTPYHFLAAASVSERASNPVRRLRYYDGDLTRGVEELRNLGVRYYLAYRPAMVTKAALDPRLVEVGVSGPWHVYEVQDWSIVTPLSTRPIVANGVTGGGDPWLELGTSWFQDPASWPAVPVASGPADWQRVDLLRTPSMDERYLGTVAPEQAVDAVPLPPVEVSEVGLGDGEVRFRVDRVGVPVLVRVGYFPNWRVEGGAGPYRVAPNFMVVIPDRQEVRLVYGYTSLDVVAYALTFLGLVLVVVLWRRGPLRYPKPAALEAAPVSGAVEVRSPFVPDDAGDGTPFVEPEPTAPTIREVPTTELPPPVLGAGPPSEAPASGSSPWSPPGPSTDDGGPNGTRPPG
jgi:hypothetical protein